MMCCQMISRWNGFISIGLIGLGLFLVIFWGRLGLGVFTIGYLLAVVLLAQNSSNTGLEGRTGGALSMTLIVVGMALVGICPLLFNLFGYDANLIAKGIVYFSDLAIIAQESTETARFILGQDHGLSDSEVYQFSEVNRGPIITGIFLRVLSYLWVPILAGLTLFERARDLSTSSSNTSVRIILMALITFGSLIWFLDFFGAGPLRTPVQSYYDMFIIVFFAPVWFILTGIIHRLLEGLSWN